MSRPEPTSIGALLARHASERPTAVALRSKRRGIWELTTWQALQSRVETVAAAMLARGVQAGDRVALVGENSPSWVVADLAIQWLGAHSAALAPQTPAEVVAALLADGEIRTIVCGDQEQVDLVLEAEGRLPTLQRAFVIDVTGVRLDADPRLVAFAELERGDATAPLAPSSGIVVHSAGSAGPPRPVAHDAAAVAELATHAAGWLGLTPADRNLCAVSLALPGARVLDLYAPLVAGSEVCLPEGPATIAVDLVEAQPTVLTTTPRGLALLRWASEGRARVASPRRRRGYERAMRRMTSGLDAHPPTVDAPGGRGGLRVRRVRAQLGLRRTRRISVVGGPAVHDDARFFWALGVPAVDVYGSAELAGVALAQDGLAAVGTVGRPLPGVEAEVLPDGALGVRSPVTGGAVLDTGDLASTDDDGRTRIRGRRSDLVDAADGSSVVAAEVEHALEQSRYVRRAAVGPAGGGGVVALVEVDFDTTAGWAADHDIAFSTYGSLVTLPEVQELVLQDVQRIGGDLPEGTRVTRTVLLPRPLDVGEGELTPVLTVRRAVVLQRFAEQAAGAPA